MTYAVGDKLRDGTGNIYEIVALRHTDQYAVNRDSTVQVRRCDGTERWVSESAIEATCRKHAP
ncbi:hypothetical protein VQ042_11635 [Aurantimonas sp. A2-1-M11]|uniref:hypothetical protein n=1 Tax=Aurantimonas sp. A2-1-M11 TaxID=3113712 RepID=UPI002F92F9D7